MEKNSEYWEKRLASETWKTYNSLEEKNRELLEFYIDASESVKDELYRLAEKYSKDGVLSLSDMHKQNRLTELNGKFEKIIEDLGHSTEAFAKKNMQDGFRKVYADTAESMGDIDFSMPNKKLMEKLMETPWRGDNFSGRLWKNQKKLAVSLNDILLTGLQQGKTAVEIAIMLHNRMGQGFNECHRLVRTETMHYLNDATLQRYKDADVKYVQILAARDERTCDICGGYHEKVYPIEECIHVPLHANCRCTIIPVTDEKLIVEYERKLGKKIPKGDIADKTWKKRIGNIMKISIPYDVYKTSRMNKATKRKIESAIRRLEKEYTVYLDGIEGGKMKKGDIFGSGGFVDDDGVLRFELLFNYNVDYQKVERRIVVKDIIDHTPGRLYIGDQYLSCYISGDIKTDAFMGVPIQVKNLTVVTDHPFWITDKKYEFKKGVEGKGVGYLDFPFDTPFDLMGDEKGTGSITIEHYAACDFLLTIYGPCLNPRIVIGDNLYEVRTKLDGGEYLLIDSREGTVFRVRTNGTKVNEFDNRVTSPNSPFEKIQPRYNLVSWDGSFGFDLLLFIERSEPKCAQKR